MTDPPDPIYEAPRISPFKDRIWIEQVTDAWYAQCLVVTAEQARDLADRIYRFLDERG